MPSYLVYEKKTGRVIQLYTTTEENPAMVYDTETTGQVHVGTVPDMTRVYIRDGRVVQRPPNTVTLTGHMLTNIPVPSSVVINGASYPCDDTTAELEFEYPGTYHIRVESWPHMDKEFVVENPA